MKTYKQTKLEKIMLELVSVSKNWRETDSESAKTHYEYYAKILIERNFPAEQIDKLHLYWNGLKKNVS